MPSPYLPWRIAGSYFESCNCDAICPCRMIGGRPGGRSTHGVCCSVLSWQIAQGRAGEVVLDGLAAAFVARYDDDEPGSPWQFIVHVDERGDAAQREALSAILIGLLGGDVARMPWARKPSKLLEVKASRIEIVNGADGNELRVGSSVDLAASRPVPTDEPVACVVPGYDRPGVELYADRLLVSDGPFAWDFRENCAFAGAFDYASG